MTMRASISRSRSARTKLGNESANLQVMKHAVPACDQCGRARSTTEKPAEGSKTEISSLLIEVAESAQTQIKNRTSSLSSILANDQLALKQVPSVWDRLIYFELMRLLERLDRPRNMLLYSVVFFSVKSILQ